MTDHLRSDDFDDTEFSGEPAIIAAPWSTKAAFWLWLTEALIAIINGVLVLSYGPTLAAGLDPSLASTTTGVTIAVGVLLIVVALFRALCAFSVLRGRTWAKYTLTILGAIGVGSALTQVTTAPGTTIASVLVTIAAIVFMYLPDSNAYFRRISEERLAAKARG